MHDAEQKLKKSPLISVIMGVYNCEATLASALDCLLAQTVQDWELVLCDDGSVDGTLTIAKRYQSQYPERILLLENQKNLGLNATLNRCLAVARGTYIARMDGDDLCSSDRLERELAILETDADVDIVSSSMQLFDENGIWGSISHPEYPVAGDFVHGSPFCHAPCMVRKAAFDTVQGYTEKKSLLRVEDYHLWVKMYAAGYRGRNLPEPLYQMRDDRNAMGRRKFKYRLNEAYVRLLAVKNLHLPIWKSVFALRPILVGMMPPFFYNFLHHKRLKSTSAHQTPALSACITEQKWKISIIIPVYKVEKYLSQCVESVLRQTYPHYEIILVDDGSPDASGNMCDSYAAQHAHVHVIHQANQGTAQARNAGIRAATGDYIMFLDGDDWWDDENALQHLVNRLHQTCSDVLCFSYKKVNEHIGTSKPYFQSIPAMPPGKNRRQQLDYLTRRSLYISSACTKVIRKAVLDANVHFRPGVYSEDIEWCAHLMLKARSFDFVCENFYCYRKNAESATHTISSHKCTDLKDNILRCMALAAQADEDCRKALQRYTAYQLATFFLVQAWADHVSSETLHALHSCTKLLKYHCGNAKVWLLHLASTTFGFENTCLLIQKVVQFKQRKET